jgi:hypothetical protein
MYVCMYIYIYMNIYIYIYFQVVAAPLHMTMAARVCASLLAAVGMSEVVAATLPLPLPPHILAHYTCIVAFYVYTGTYAW